MVNMVAMDDYKTTIQHILGILQNNDNDSYLLTILVKIMFHGNELVLLQFTTFQQNKMAVFDTNLCNFKYLQVMPKYSLVRCRHQPSASCSVRSKKEI